MRKTVQIWASPFLFSPLPFFNFPQPSVLPASKGFALCVAINWLLPQISDYARKIYSSTPPCCSLFLIFSSVWMDGQVEKRRGPPAPQKNVQISHLVVFMLLAPCGPWRCWKHGKHRRDQSNLINISSVLEWPGCMATPGFLVRPRDGRLCRCALQLFVPLCSFKTFFFFCHVMLTFLGRTLPRESWEKKISSMLFPITQPKWMQLCYLFFCSKGK